MASDDLQERFRTWLRDPAGGAALQLDRFPASAEGALQMIEAAMWHAYQQGYATCKADVGHALDALDVAGSKSPA